MHVNRLTALLIESLKPRDVEYEVTDGSVRVCVKPTGHKSFLTRYRRPGGPKTAKLTHGSWPAMTLAQARVAAATAKLDVSRGVDPGAAKKRAKADAKAAAAKAAGDTVGRWAEEFLESHVRKNTRPNSQVQAEYIFRRIVCPAWQDRTVHSIARRDIKELTREVVDSGRPVMANRVKSCVSTFFRWLVDEDVLVGSPCLGIKQPAKEVARERVLSHHEIRVFWNATDTLSAPFGDIYKLLLLSAARRQEVGEMQWRELDLAERVWTIPAERAKGKLAVVLPLGPLAWEIIERQPRIVGSDYVFGRRHSSFAHLKRSLDEAMKVSDPWVNHDLRRTARSLLSRARAPSDVAEMMLGHVLPGTIRRTYDKHKYLDEKRAGFAALEREIDLIRNPPKENVVPLRHAP